MKWRDLAEHQIQKAKAEGQLDGLKGQGAPLPSRPAGDVVTAGMGIMAEAGVLPREIELKKAAQRLRAELGTLTDAALRQPLMRELSEVEMRLAIEQEARRKFYRTS